MVTFFFWPADGAYFYKKLKFLSLRAIPSAPPNPKNSAAWS